MSSLLVIGETGQLGSALKHLCESQQKTTIFLSRKEFDLSAPPETLKQKLSILAKPSAIILAAAYTDVEGTETDCETAYWVNVRATDIIAQYCESEDIPLIYVSTDYVFDGRKSSPYEISDTTNPLNFYGESKRLGEEAVLMHTKKSCIMRTSWVFDGTHKNFLTTMLKLAKERAALNIVSDQKGRPTYAAQLAQACLNMAEALIENNKEARGIFHVTGQGEPVSWAEFAAHIFDHASLSTEITPVLSQDYPTIAERPLNSVLSNARYNALFNDALPSWQQGLKEAIAEYNRKFERNS